MNVLQSLGVSAVFGLLACTTQPPLPIDAAGDSLFNGDSNVTQDTSSSADTFTATDVVSADGSTANGTASIVRVSGRRLLVQKRAMNGTLLPETPYDMKGVCWSPYGPNEPFESGGNNLVRFSQQDSAMMNAAHINTVRTYGAFPRTAQGRAALDTLYARGIMVAMTVFAAYENADAEATVNYYKDHPAVLFWIVGNEWNYNRLYSAHTLDECFTRVNAVIAAIHTADPEHPVATVWGEIPADADIARLNGVDIWGSNLYPWLDFGDRFSRWATLSPAPLFVAEYGSDAYRRNADGSGMEDTTSQTQSLQALTQLIRQNLSANNAGVLLGGAPFEWNDEWWKSGNAAVHDTAGFANQGVYSDRFANEEWWGLVDANRAPRPALTQLTSLYQ